MERKLKQKTKEEYKQARNEYVRVRRQEEKRYEKDVVDKCKEEPKHMTCSHSTNKEFWAILLKTSKF